MSSLSLPCPRFSTGTQAAHCIPSPCAPAQITRAHLHHTLTRPNTVTNSHKNSVPLRACGRQRRKTSCLAAATPDLANLAVKRPHGVYFNSGTSCMLTRHIVNVSCMICCLVLSDTQPRSTTAPCISAPCTTCTLPMPGGAADRRRPLLPPCRVAGITSKFNLITHILFSSNFVAL